MNWIAQSSRASYIARGGKKLTRVIEQEGKIEKKAMSVAIAELAELLKIQQTAVKVRLTVNSFRLL